jgi:hypothetical protein
MIHGFLMTSEYGSQPFRHSDSRHEVRNRQEKVKLIIQPLIDAIILTFGAMPVSAGVIAVMDFSAFSAKPFLSAQFRRSAGFNTPHHFLVRRQDIFFVLFEIFGSVLAENVCQRTHRSRIT